MYRRQRPASPVTVYWNDSDAFGSVAGLSALAGATDGYCVAELPEADDGASAVVSNTADHRTGTMTADCSGDEWSATSTSCTATHCPATDALSPWTGADGASCDDDGGGQLPESMIGAVDVFADTVEPTTGEASVVCVADSDSPSTAAWQVQSTPGPTCSSAADSCVHYHPFTAFLDPDTYTGPDGLTHDHTGNQHSHGWTDEGAQIGVNDPVECAPQVGIPPEYPNCGPDSPYGDCVD